MLTKQWKSVLVQVSPINIVPLSHLYDDGFFISAIYGNEAWIINQKTFESKPVRFIGAIPKEMCPSMIRYNDKQYKRFLRRYPTPTYY